MKKSEECFKCNKKIDYMEKLDEANNETMTLKMRKVVVINEQNETIPFFSLPLDKRRLVDQKHIKFLCAPCSQL